jgi:hypothetical protein
MHNTRHYIRAFRIVALQEEALDVGPGPTDAIGGDIPIVLG